MTKCELCGRDVHILPRDSHGWRVPKHGSLARKVYVMMLQRYSANQIAARLAISSHKAATICYKIKHPDKANLWRNQYRRRLVYRHAREAKTDA